MGEQASGGDTGMVLPFVPSAVTFQDIHYFVEVPKVKIMRMHTRANAAQSTCTASSLPFAAQWAVFQSLCITFDTKFPNIHSCI